MSRPGVTFQHVAEAAIQLLSQGKNPTIEQVRHLLGTGSSTTIATHLKRWKEEQQGTSLLIEKEHIPEELIRLLQGLWERVIDHSEEKMQEIKFCYQQESETFIEEIEKYKKNNKRWQLLFNQWTIERESLVNKNTHLENTVLMLEKEKAELQAKADGLKQQIQEKQDRINELFKLHKQAQANLEYDREIVQKERYEEQQKIEQLRKVWLLQQTELKEKLFSFEQNNKLLQQSLNSLEQRQNLEREMWQLSKK